jgi:hypothetical protein
MNQERRKDIDKAISAVEVWGELQKAFADKAATLRREFEDLHEKAQELRGKIEDIQSEEQAGFDNLNEGLQQAENGQRVEEAINHLEEALQHIDGYEELADDFLPTLDVEELVGFLDNAKAV